jgi:hypothetical protein
MRQGDRHRERYVLVVSDQPTPAPRWPKRYGPQDAPKEVLDLAHRLMTLLLAGDHPFCTALHEQLVHAKIRQVELTGVGFFVSYDVSADVPFAVPTKFAGGHADIRVEGIPNSAGCVLFVDHGVIQMLEVYTYGTDEFPEHPVIVGIENASPVSSYLRKTP